MIMLMMLLIFIEAPKRLFYNKMSFPVLTFNYKLTIIYTNISSDSNKK